ncbi:PIN domain-containing protein [Metabacillus idriensis]|uniref:type II toxin-antitoxin system VapC family toxin n=1 Tax=Metabacillus idriensis TaxID=324768 RepID=UPI00203CD6EB|nr:PIN domain-containing protein [Metabacillus idriensis]MCM3596206.1 PIN domain-containing protein [Metabacillus idriensis]
MRPNVIHIAEFESGSFPQASFYIDACFLLAFLDQASEEGELVERVLQKLEKEDIDNLIISNHVVSEVIHHLYLGNIYNVIYTAFRKFKLNHHLNENEEKLLGNPFVAKKLMELVSPPQLNRMRTAQGVSIPIKEIIKAYKERYADRNFLSYYYEMAVDRFNLLCSSLGEWFNIQIRHVASDEETFYFAQEFMSELQLEIKDSLHLALAKQYKADYFATLDGDFIHNFYNEDHLEETTILHISKRYI